MELHAPICRTTGPNRVSRRFNSSSVKTIASIWFVPSGLCAVGSQLSGSVCGLPLFGAADTDVVTAPPMLSSGADDADHFVRVKRLRQHVPGSQIQGFRPQAFIRQPGSYDKERGIGEKRDLVQHPAPGARRDFAIADDDWKGYFPEQRKGRGNGGACCHGPTGLEDALQSSAIFIVWADGQNDIETGRECERLLDAVQSFDLTFFHVPSNQSYKPA